MIVPFCHLPADVDSAAPRAQYIQLTSSISGAQQRLLLELDRLAADCQEEGWDGHGSSAVDQQAYLAARRFVHSLPPGMPTPTVSADPDGCATFEWYVNPRKLVLLSIHRNYRIDFATVIGEATNYGSEPFFNVLPSKIVDLVQRIGKV